MFSIITVHDQGSAFVLRTGYTTEQAAKMQRGKLVKKNPDDSFAIVADDKAEAFVLGLNNGTMRYENGEIIVVPPVVTTNNQTETREVVVKGRKQKITTVLPNTESRVPANILHMISVTSGNAHRQWINIATRLYGYRAV